MTAPLESCYSTDSSCPVTEARGDLRISIVIACLDVAPMIDRCLDSIARQDYPEIEVIVVDGGSVDGTQDALLARSASMRHPFSWFSELDCGIPDAWNKGIAHATGRWLLFLGADDVLAAPDVISRAAASLRNVGVAHRVVYGQIAMVNSSGSVLAIVDRPWSARSFRDCSHNLPHQAVFHHRSLFETNGPFDTRYSIVADFDLLLRELMFREPLYVSNLLVCMKQIGGISNCARYAPRGVMEQIRLFRSHVGGASTVLYWALVKAWIKYALYALGGDELVAKVIRVASQPRLQRSDREAVVTPAAHFFQQTADRVFPRLKAVGHHDRSGTKQPIRGRP
jgi:glycosyltransferase involved in cell wall biosynthesis